MELDRINERLAEVHRGRKWIVAHEVAVGTTAQVRRLRDWGASGVMVVAGLEGVGDLPLADQIFYTRSGGDTVMDAIRAYLDSVEHPEPKLQAAVDEFDPDGEARVITSGFASYATVCGRAVHDYRRPEWVAFEDKTVIDELWDAAGVTRAPSAVVPVDEAPAAERRLGGPRGTVWVADNREGWHGGTEYGRWIEHPDDVAPAVAWFRQHADRVRVMPFLDGIPCSIHAIVTQDGVAVFDPVEMVILRRTDRPGFVYARAATFWTPPNEVVEEMRGAARSVGRELARSVGYRGAFGIDGVCTRDGFRPTELNPRFSVGHALRAAAAELPLEDINRLIVAGDLAVDAGRLEDRVLAARDKRAGGLLFIAPGLVEPVTADVIFRDGGAVVVENGNERDAVMEVGSGPGGTVIRLALEPDRIPVGPSVAPLAVQAARLAAELWGVDLPPVEPAPDLCT